MSAYKDVGSQHGRNHTPLDTQDTRPLTMVVEVLEANLPLLPRLETRSAGRSSHFRARHAKTLQSSNLRKQIRSEVDLHPVVREIVFVLVELCRHFYRNTLITRVGRAE